MTIIKLGISSCLLGERVRWNGEHKLDRFLTDTLGKFVQYLSVCPEVECGFGVPRESVHLVGDPRAPRLITTRTNQDHTERMLRWARRRVCELEQEGPSGFIFKSKSPSCGTKQVKVYNEKGVSARKGMGFFARAVTEHFPLLPVEDEERFHDPELRENFLERIFTMKRWREMVTREQGLSDLVNFHTGHKLLILSHSPRHYRDMGRLVDHANELPVKVLYKQYQQLLMEALLLKATSAKHVTVLQHIMGYFKKELSPYEKQELWEVIDHYRQGDVPLIVPVTLINHYVRRYDQPYLKQQYYLNPPPLKLQLLSYA